MNAKDIADTIAIIDKPDVLIPDSALLSALFIAAGHVPVGAIYRESSWVIAFRKRGFFDRWVDNAAAFGSIMHFFID